MEKLWTISELMERYGWAEITTIRKTQREMRHIGKGKKIRVPVIDSENTLSNRGGL